MKPWERYQAPAPADSEAPAPTAKPWEQFSNSKGPELRNYEPTYRDQAGAWIDDTARSLGINPTTARNLALGLTGSAGVGTETVGAGDFVPGVGTVFSAQDAQKDFEAGRNVSGALNTAATALSVIPGASAIARYSNAAPAPNPNLAVRAHQLNTAQPNAAPLTVPRAMAPEAGAVSRTTADLASRGSGIPVLGTPLADGVQASRAALNERVAQEAARAGPGGAGIDVVGDTVSGVARDWMTTITKDDVGLAYDAVRNSIPATYRGQMPALKKVVDALKAEDAASFSTANAPAIQAVEAALASPNGITVEGAEKLRQILSKQAAPGFAIAENATAQPAFKRAAGALGRDVEKMIVDAGGAPAVKAMADAKQTYKYNKKIRNAVEKVMGKGAIEGGVSGEKIVHKLKSMASSKSTGDVNSLMQFRRAVDPDTWKSMARSINDNMGMDAAGEWSALKWSKEFGKMSTNGQNVLYGPKLAGDYRDITRFMTDFVKAQSRMGNPSRSGDLAAGASLVAYAAHKGMDGVAYVTLKVLGGRRFMRYWGSPRVVEEMSNLTKLARQRTGQASGVAKQAALRGVANAIRDEGGDADAFEAEVARAFNQPEPEPEPEALPNRFDFTGRGQQ